MPLRSLPPSCCLLCESADWRRAVKDDESDPIVGRAPSLNVNWLNGGALCSRATLASACRKFDLNSSGAPQASNWRCLFSLQRVRESLTLNSSLRARSTGAHTSPRPIGNGPTTLFDFLLLARYFPIGAIHHQADATRRRRSSGII